MHPAGRKRVAGKQRARNTPTTQKNQQRAANLQVEDGRCRRNLSGCERERERQEKGVRVGVGGDGGFLGGGCGDQIALGRAEGLAHLPIIALGIRSLQVEATRSLLLQEGCWGRWDRD